jgi:DNA polymerase-3 subunit epsilon
MMWAEAETTLPGKRAPLTDQWLEGPDATELPDWADDLVPIDRPLAVLDLETTGTAVFRDRIVEIAIVKIHPDGRKESRCRRLNPGIPIPSVSAEIHGIRDEDVAHEPEFRQIASGLAKYLEGCDIGGFGVVQFDVPLLRAEFERADVDFPMTGRRVIDAKAIFHAKEPRTLSAAHRFYCGAPFEGAHSAEADAVATYKVLVAQLRRYSDLPNSMTDLHRFSNPREADYVDSSGKLIWQGNEVFFNFGKHRGEPLREVCVTDQEYVSWLTMGELPAELKTILAAALQGQLPERPMERRTRRGRPSSSEESRRQPQLPWPGDSDPAE